MPFNHFLNDSKFEFLPINQAKLVKCFQEKAFMEKFGFPLQFDVLIEKGTLYTFHILQSDSPPSILQYFFLSRFWQINFNLVATGQQIILAAFEMHL